jgi:hypothetical protein
MRTNGRVQHLQFLRNRPKSSMSMLRCVSYFLLRYSWIQAQLLRCLMSCQPMTKPRFVPTITRNGAIESVALMAFRAFSRLRFGFSRESGRHIIPTP